MLVAVLLCLTACAAGEEFYAGVLKSPKAMLKLYNDFKTQEHQAFPSASENRFRFRVFRKTVEFIAQENAIDNGYESGLNFFADLTDQERQQYLGVNMSLFMPAPQDKPRTSKIASDRSDVKTTSGGASDRNTADKPSILRPDDDLIRDEKRQYDRITADRTDRDHQNDWWFRLTASDKRQYDRMTTVDKDDFWWRITADNPNSEKRQWDRITADNPNSEKRQWDRITADKPSILRPDDDLVGDEKRQWDRITADRTDRDHQNDWWFRLTASDKRQYDRMTVDKDDFWRRMKADGGPDDRVVDAPMFPSSKSWIAEGAVTRVKNQGSCGSCWTFGAASSMETFYKAKSGVLRAFSEQELLDCTYDSNPNKDGCNGGWPSDCFTYAKAGHLASEKDYGYRAKDNKCRASSYKNALIGAKVTGFETVSKGDFMTALSHGSLAVAFEVTNKFSMYKGGIFKDSECHGRINHAVTAVAYTPAYILVKNSWGGSWGDRGFVKFIRNYDNCGLLNYASHPTMVATSTKDTNAADIATNYDPDDQNTPTDAPDPNPNCYDRASDCTKAYCQWESFSKKNCAKTCGHCHNDEDPTNSGDCPSGTTRCPDGTCKHIHMC